MADLKEPVYIGRKRCGCIIVATVDEPKYRDDNARLIAELIRDGLTVERVETQYVRDNMKRCTHD